MYEPLCSCGHAFARHGDARGACRERTCRCVEYRSESLAGVYNLSFARRLLQKRSGRPLLRSRTPGLPHPPEP
jgi:hypothetical protein